MRSNMQPTRVIFFGTGNFAVSSLRYMAKDTRYDVMLVVTQPDRPQGRKQEYIPSPVKQAALRLGLEVWQPESIKEAIALARIRSYQPDVMVLASYGKILSQEILDIAPHGILNLHGSLLPQLRGASPIQTAIAQGYQETGVTLMVMDNKMDHGTLLAQQALTLTGKETTPELETLLADIGAELLRKHLQNYLDGTLAAQEQRHHAATFCQRIKKEDGIIDWEKSAVDLERHLRAYTPWPGSYTYWKGKKLTLHKALVSHEQSPLSPGTVYAMPSPSSRGSLAKIAISCGKGSLVVEEVQLEGKKLLPIEAFMRGCPKFVGGILLRAPQ